MKIEEADVVVGIFWRRFGTPTSTSPSGTAHELGRAVEAYRSKGRPQVMVYFNSAPATPVTTAEIDQWRAVIEFRERFPSDGLWWSYSGSAHFEQLFRSHLQTFLFSSLDRTQPSRLTVGGLLEPPTVQDAVGRPASAGALLAALKQHPVVVLGGLSGAGKTYLAASQLANARDTRVYKSVLWHDPSPGESIDSLLAVLADTTALPGESTISRCKALAAHLRESGALLVVDNFHLVDQASYEILLSASAGAAAPCRLLLLSQTYVTLAVSAVHHVQLSGLSASEARDLLRSKNLGALEERTVEELVSKTGGLPFAIALFTVLVVDFGHDPGELLAGAMEGASRIRAWFDRILAALDEGGRRLLAHLGLLDVPFNIGVVKAVGRGLLLANPDATFESLQRHFLVSRHTHYRWTVHELLRTLAQPLISGAERAAAHALLGHHFLRGLPRRRAAVLSPDEFLSKVRAFRHLARCPDQAPLAEAVLSELSGTTKMRGHYALFLELSRALVLAGSAAHPWITYHHAHCALILGRRDYCRTLVQPLLYEPAVVGSPEIRLSLTRLYAESLGSLGQSADAISVLKEAMDAAPEGVRQMIPYVQAKTVLSWLLTRTGSFTEAAQLARELLAEAQRKNDTRGGAVGWASLGVAQLQSGQLSDAATALDAAKELFEEARDRRGTAWALASAAECSLMAGAHARAEQNLREAAAIAADIGECSVDLEECLERMMAASPSASIAAMIRAEQSRIHQQVAVKLARLDS